MKLLKDNKAKVKKLVTLSKINDAMIKEYAAKTGMSQSDVFMELMTHGKDKFKLIYGLDSPQKNDDIKISADNLNGKELAKFAQESSEKRLMRKLLFDVDNSEGWQEES